MKHIFTTLFLLTALTSLLAQTPTQFGAVLQLLGEEGQTTFIDQLDGLNDSLFTDRFDGLRFSEIDLGGAQDSLFFYLGQGDIPGADSLDLFWSYNQGELESFLNSDTLSAADSSTLSTTFFSLNDNWDANYDSLNTLGELFGGFGGGELEGEVNDGDIRWDQYQGPWVQSYRDLLNSEFLPALSTGEVENDLEEVVENNIFSSMLDFEIAYGQSWNDNQFYKESYRTQSSAIRIASVPTYKQPFEFRWALNAAFFQETESLPDDMGVGLIEGINPLYYNGNAAFLYLPRFGSLGELGSFHLYTSIGIDLGTYVPSHANDHSPVEAARVGKTTGFGPEVGAGFVINYGDFSAYSYATIATGSVVNDLELNYNYDASTLNAGIRFGNAVNVMYTSGVSSWAPRAGKRTQFSRFTVGVILDELIYPGN